MFEFDLQRFDEDLPAQGESAPPPADSASSETTEEKPLPEELNGLPEDIARETFAEWERSQTSESEPAADENKPPGAVPYDRFKEKVDEANQLKAQLAQYQQQVQQFQQFQQAQQLQQLQQLQAQQAQQQRQQQPPPPPQPTITPEVAKKINQVIEAEAMRMTNFTPKDVEELEFVDDSDAKLAQWKYAKSVAQSNVFSAIRQAQYERQVQAQQFLANHAAAVQNYNEYATKAFAEPDFQAIQNFAINDFFLSHSKEEQGIIANSYLQIERKVASPAEMMLVKNFFEQAKAAYRAQGAKRQAQPQQQQAAKLPRTDQISGVATTVSDGLSEREIEKMLEGDFTKIDPSKQKFMLGLS